MVAGSMAIFGGSEGLWEAPLGSSNGQRHSSVARPKGSRAWAPSPGSIAQEAQMRCHSEPNTDQSDVTAPCSVNAMDVVPRCSGRTLSVWLGHLPQLGRSRCCISVRIHVTARVCPHVSGPTVLRSHRQPFCVWDASVRMCTHIWLLLSQGRTYTTSGSFSHEGGRDRTCGVSCHWWLGLEMRAPLSGMPPRLMSPKNMHLGLFLSQNL